jgi:hypothetical protein
VPRDLDRGPHMFLLPGPLPDQISPLLGPPSPSCARPASTIDAEITPQATRPLARRPCRASDASASVDDWRGIRRFVYLGRSGASDRLAGEVPHAQN